MEEVYKGMLITPMGNINGKLTIITNDNKISGYIEAMGKKNMLQNIKKEGNKYEFSGVITYFLGKIQYKAIAKIQNDKLEAKIQSNMGEFELIGTKEK